MPADVDGGVGTAVPTRHDVRGATRADGDQAGHPGDAGSTRRVRESAATDTSTSATSRHGVPSQERRVGGRRRAQVRGGRSRDRGKPDGPAVAHARDGVAARRGKEGGTLGIDATSISDSACRPEWDEGTSPWRS